MAKEKNIKKANSKGITLVALVVTIVVLLILAGITITMLFGENGIIKKAQDAAEATKNDQETTANGLANLEDQMVEALDNSSLKQLAKAGTIVTERKEVTDKVGNKVVVPKGFRLTTEGLTVQNGVVIEDSAGNQFVWIPVGEVTLNDGTKSNEIKLGRYTFASSSAATPGKPTLRQAAYTTENPTNYAQEVTIDSYYKELATRTSNSEGLVDDSNHLNDLNAIAKDLAGFVESVKTNGGYYMARYEASYGSGYNSSGADDAAKYGSAKPLSKKSTATSFSSSTVGSLWNNITQLNASKVCQNMYVENKDASGKEVGVESDLMNSYAWDTAIVYIQEMGINNFANKKNTDVGSSGSNPSNTGSNSKDKFCNIYDMVANTLEWTTEHSTITGSSSALPCVLRGGSYSSSGHFTAYMSYCNATLSRYHIGFRPLLYVTD